MANPLDGFMNFPAAFGYAVRGVAILLLIGIIFGCGSCWLKVVNGH
jgi:hypothetical protein